MRAIGCIWQKKKKRYQMKEREEYLKELANEYGVDYFFVSALAEVLGENEDYDALVEVVGYLK